MAMARKPDIASAIAGGGGDMPEPEMDMAKEAKVEAVSRLMSAIKSGDKEGAAMAFSDAVEACQSYGPDEDL